MIWHLKSLQTCGTITQTGLPGLYFIVSSVPEATCPTNAADHCIVLQYHSAVLLKVITFVNIAFVSYYQIPLTSIYIHRNPRHVAGTKADLSLDLKPEQI